jgi:hypothetical protein
MLGALIKAIVDVLLNVAMDFISLFVAFVIAPTINALIVAAVFLVCRRHRVSLPPSLPLPPTTASRFPAHSKGDFRASPCFLLVRPTRSHRGVCRLLRPRLSARGLSASSSLSPAVSPTDPLSGIFLSPRLRRNWKAPGDRGSLNRGLAFPGGMEGNVGNATHHYKARGRDGDTAAPLFAFSPDPPGIRTSGLATRGEKWRSNRTILDLSSR